MGIRLPVLAGDAPAQRVVLERGVSYAAAVFGAMPVGYCALRPCSLVSRKRR
ncbi:MAG: hypothetical protein HOP36_16430 [Methyloglobulus sp.]|nr:hypothetical protein [Methyloglobulus sp.]